MDAHVLAFTAAGDVSDEVVAAFKRVSQARSARIKDLESQLAALPDTPVNTVTAREIHEELAKTDLADDIADARERGDLVTLREILQKTVRSARSVARHMASGKDRRTT